MISEKKYSKGQVAALLLLRFSVGWHILYEGVSKVNNTQWTSADFLKESRGVMSGVSGWILSNPGLLEAVDFLNAWGLVAIGLGLIFGLFLRPAAIIGSILVFFYYLNAPPMVGFEYTLPAEGSNLVVNRTLIEAIALLVLALFPTSKPFGLDYFIKRKHANGGIE